jgi:VCBS repeat protein
MYGFRSWAEAMGWCTHSGAQLRLGDFNGDGRTDMFCHDGGGYKSVAYTSSAGHPGAGGAWGESDGFCTHSGAQLHLGDFNGDGRTDMLCHDAYTGYKWFAYTDEAGRLRTGGGWDGPFGRWCSANGGVLQVARFNDDGKADLFCHETASTWKLVSYMP